jgi:hypothetical protein
MTTKHLIKVFKANASDHHISDATAAVSATSAFMPEVAFSSEDESKQVPATVAATASHVIVALSDRPGML